MLPWYQNVNNCNDTQSFEIITAWRAVAAGNLELYVTIPLNSTDRQPQNIA